jgi:hypothetical protein
MVNESLLVLDKYNFHDWEFELEGLCSRNKATDEFAKFSWLSETLNISDKRLVMKYKMESIVVSRTVKDKTENVVIKGISHPYSWAIEV